MRRSMPRQSEPRRRESFQHFPSLIRWLAPKEVKHGDSFRPFFIDQQPKLAQSFDFVLSHHRQSRLNRPSANIVGTCMTDVNEKLILQIPPVRMDQPTYLALMQQAMSEDRPVSYIVRKALAAYLESHGRMVPPTEGDAK
jgi:hypothetical protein